MAGRDEAREVCRKRRVREFVASWFLERCLAKDEQETASIDLGKRLSSEFMMPLKDKAAKLVAVDGERKRFSGAEAAIDKIHTGKMDKTAVEVFDVETAVETEKTDKCPESDDHASTEAPIDDLEYVAKLLNRSDDWIQKKRLQVKENTARSKRIMEDFVKCCVDDQGCLIEDEDDEEDDDEYEARWAMVEAYSAELWSQHNDFSGLDHYIPEEHNTMATPA